MSEASRGRGHRRGWGLYCVSLAEADADEPIDHQWEGQDGEDGQEDRAAQESGKDLLLAEEERACGDKESKAHAPEVTRDAQPAGDSASSEHTDVSGGGEQEDDAEEEAHASGSVFVGMVEGKDAERDDGGCSAEADEERDPIRPAYVSATAGKPCGGDHVKGDDAADDVSTLRFEYSEAEAARGQGQHRNGEDVSRGAMEAAAFADGNSEGAGQQANCATEDVQNQERESHTSTAFQHLRLPNRL